MKALLMHAEQDFDPEQSPPANEAELIQDLELSTLLSAMAGEDPFLLNVSRKALVCSAQNDIGTIIYRQEVLFDAARNPALVRELYELAIEAIEGKRKSHFGVFSNYPSGILSGAIDVMVMFMGVLTRLRVMSEAYSKRFRSRGFRKLFAMIEREFSDEYFVEVQRHLRELKFNSGVLISARLGDGNQGVDHVLRHPRGRPPNWFERLLGKGGPAFSFQLAERDEGGARILSEIRDRGITLVANAMAQSMDHILSFFEMLRTEVGFYVCCLNLRDRMETMGAVTCLPEPHAAGSRELSFEDLYDVCLALNMGKAIVGNTLDTDHKSLFVITGANQGGKSSFLRSIGLAQVMMQSGMFVAGRAFAAELCSGVFTHYKREEDATMNSGKLDEELVRMSAIADAVHTGALVLFNESFASTNEREGSEVARQIVNALLDRYVKVFYVTHMFELANGFFVQARSDAIFLRAERRDDGSRSFKLSEGEPLATSHGEDLYEEIFERESSAEEPAAVP
ncbi:MutS-related protein [Variovorax sp. Sphag1AA]|uniref:MutS-related protein n=1 Tax=Variovorax sp. Sphag1AA TaxID=2587027 RepID=UPI0016091CF7|nr:DNA mismatch repair protein MutS [Variovorax sp. Sphag1AA]MBB3181209.1 hypothetical protein [Variovorax sp. Sphag1AA]